MKKRLTAWAATCAVLLAIPALAAQKPAAATAKATVNNTKAVPVAWARQSMTGTIMIVDPARKLVAIKDSAGVPFDLVIDRSTRIQSGRKMLKLQDLTSDVNKKASVRFVPERRGDIALSIRMNG